MIRCASGQRETARRPAGARRSRSATALVSPSRGNGHSPSASARSAGTPAAARSRIVWATIAMRVALLLDEVAVDQRAVPGHDDRVAADQVEHDVERCRASRADGSPRRTPAGRSPRPGRRRAATSASATRTTASPEVWPRPGWASSTCRSPRSRTRTEEKVWSATTISVSRTSSRCGSSWSSAYRSLIRSPASTVRAAASSCAWIGHARRRPRGTRRCRRCGRSARGC